MAESTMLTAAGISPGDLVRDDQQTKDMCVGTFRWSTDKAMLQLPPFPNTNTDKSFCNNVESVSLVGWMKFFATRCGSDAKSIVAAAQSDPSIIDGLSYPNTGGGLVGFGHPVGATGIKQILEIFRQMKGQCGDYQVPATLNYGIAANMGGDDKTAVVSIFKNM